MFTQLAYQFNKNPQLDDDQGYQQIPTIKCPFDSSHMMQPKNFLTHVYRCKSPNKHLYVQCRYDPCHWIYPENKAQHHQNCPTRLQHYLDMDLPDGDWDDQEIQNKMEQKAIKEQHQKRKRKILKIIAYLKLKKQLEKQNHHSNHKKLPSTTGQNESDASTSYSEIKEKLKNLFIKKNHNKELEVSRAQSEADFQKKQSRVFQQARTCINGCFSMNTANLYNPYQLMQYPSPYGLYCNNGFYSSISPFQLPNFQSTQIPLQPSQQFQTLRYPQSMMLSQGATLQQPPSQQYSFIPPHYQLLAPLVYRQPSWQYQNSVGPMRSKPEPQKNLKFQVKTNTEDFIKQNIKDCQNSSQKTQQISLSESRCQQVSSQIQAKYSTVNVSNKFSLQQPSSFHQKVPQKIKRNFDSNYTEFQDPNKHQKFQENRSQNRKESRQNFDSKLSSIETKQNKNRKEKKDKKDKKHKTQKDKKKKSKSNQKQQHVDIKKTETNFTDTPKNIQYQKQIRQNQVPYSQPNHFGYQVHSHVKNYQPKYQVKNHLIDYNHNQSNPYLYQSPQLLTQHLRSHQQNNPSGSHFKNNITQMPQSSLLNKKQEIKVQSIPKYEPILDKSISTYDFDPFNFSIETTIKNDSFRLMDQKSQESIEMKEMLSILNEKIQKQKFKEKMDEITLDAHILPHNKNDHKKRDYTGH